jgi:hypothetical protein
MEVQGKGVYLLHSEVSALDFLTEVPHNCAVDDVNAMAFEEATKIIEGNDVVEKFLAYGIWLLSDGWDFEVEKTELPLLKAIVLMQKVTDVFTARETEAMFEVRIASMTNQFIRNYSSTEHRACVGQLHHGRLNRVFDLVGVNYQPL